MAKFVTSGAVVLLLLAALAVLATATPPKPSDWEFCDKHANYDVLVKNVSINPDPVVSGKDMTFMVVAYTGKELTGASVIVSVSIHGVTVHTEKSDICDKTSCPVSPGEFVLDNTEVLPGLTPPGKYRIKLQFVGEKGGQLACVNINFSIVWSASVAETLESFNPIELHRKFASKQAPVAHT